MILYVVLVAIGAPTPPNPPAIYGPVFKPSFPAAVLNPPPSKTPWVTTEDYPAQSIRKSEEGTVIVQVEVTEEGTPEHCVLVKSSGHLQLDEKSCQLMLSRGRFEAKLDETGKPVRSTKQTTFTWRLPNR